MIEVKSEDEIQRMQRAGRIVAQTLKILKEMVAPGVSTMDLENRAEAFINDAGGKPAFKGYRGFPASVCASLNEEVVHGIPSRERKIAPGDVISMDLGVKLEGFYGDSATSVAVAPVDTEVESLLRVTEESLQRAIDQCRVGKRVGDISHAVQAHVEAAGFSIVREFVGHGIGAQLHEEPQVPNYGQPGRHERLVPGMVLAIEPMVNAGGPEVLLSADDGWTARTRDGGLSAHFEVSVAITEDGPRVLGMPAPEGVQQAGGN